MLALRARQIRNMLATLLLSQGVPMLLGGDEFARTQCGNNNAYCQDNEVSWVDWTLAESHRDLVDFVRQLCEVRRSRLWLRRDTFLKGSSRAGAAKDVSWLHPSGREMQSTDWNDAAQRCIGVRLGAAPVRETSRDSLLIVFNAGDAAVDFALPVPSPAMQWLLVFDTGDSVSSEQLRSADSAGV